MGAALRELVASLSRLDGSGTALELVAAGVAQATLSEQSMVYTLERPEEQLEVGVALSSGLVQPLVRSVLSNGLVAKNKKVFAYNPTRPEPRQRNRALTFQELTVLNGGVSFGMVQEGYPRLGVGGSDNMRILICDGPTLLAWVGVFREEALGSREQRLLQQLAAPLKHRLLLDLHLERAQLRAAALDVTLELLPYEAYVVHISSRRVRVVLANRLAHTALDTNRSAVHEALRRATAAPNDSSEFTVLSFIERGLPDYALITRRTGRVDRLTHNLAIARQRWGLTPRQMQVLALLARGLANKTIALQLECAESTVELHVTALLSRTQSESRAALVASLWSLEG
jgi:DNA-binding CsgD family transcriptional regulator